MLLGQPLAQSPSPSPSPEEKYPIGSYEGANTNFKSFWFQSKRKIKVSQKGVQKKRSDEVEVKQDEKGNYWFKKITSEDPGSLEYYWVDREVHRVDTDQSFPRQHAKTVFMPLFQKNMGYWKEFWEKFGGKIQLRKDGHQIWQGRPCDRLIVEKKDSEETNFVEIKGEILIDRDLNIVLKSSLEAHYTESATLPKEESSSSLSTIMEDSPFEISIILNESIQKMDKVEPVQFPKSKKPNG